VRKGAAWELQHEKNNVRGAMWEKRCERCSTGKEVGEVQHRKSNMRATTWEEWHDRSNNIGGTTNGKGRGEVPH
jgi:hypothetical protein